MIEEEGKLDIKDKNKIMLSDGNIFDILKFQQDLKDNNKKIDKIKNAGFVGKTINIFSGRQAEVTLDALNLNNQFLEFTIFVHEILMKVALEAREHRSDLENIINNRDESLSKTENQLFEIIAKLNHTEKKLSDFLIENKNISEELKNLYSQIDYLKNNDLNKINNDLLHSVQLINEMREQISVLIKRDKLNKILLFIMMMAICWVFYYFNTLK
jgi:hypothetical protein